jgi:hypothetical protein
MGDAVAIFIYREMMNTSPTTNILIEIVVSSSGDNGRRERLPGLGIDPSIIQRI